MNNEFNQTTLLKLIDKYLSGQATKEEKAFLEAYYEYFEKEEAILETATAQQKEQLKQQMLVAIMQEIGQPKQTGTVTPKVLPQAHRRPVWKTFARIAAIVVFGAMLSLYFIADDPVGLITGNQTITAVADQGQPKDIFLPDGSIVTLNEGSSLSYPSQFDESNREVELKGEGYFDIKHNASHPFIVNSGQVNVRVLGTAFNVKARSGEEQIEVTVTRGKVQVSESSGKDRTLGTITANQQISYDKVTGDFKQTDTKAANVTEWKPAQYTMDDVTLAEAARIIEKRFDKDVVFKGQEVPDYAFTASFYEQDSLEEILLVIAKISDTKYRIEQDKVIIISVQ